MTLQVGVVARCLNAEHIRGMGRYVQEVVKHSAGDTSFAFTLFGNDRRYPLRLSEKSGIKTDVFEFRGDRLELWEQIGLPRRARCWGIDVLHCSEGTLPWWQPVPTVVTVHDTLAWAERDEGALSRLYFDKLLPRALRKAAAVITISESSRRDICERWPELQAKLHVISHGIGDEYLSDDDPAPSELQRSLVGRDYVVYVGGPMTRKRFTWALQVQCAVGRPDLHMVACGFTAKARDEAAACLPEASRGRVHFAPFLSDDELRALYRGAKAMLYPTLYEGFGFPAVEAQAAGVPSLFSRVSSLAELVGPLAIDVDPHQLDSWQAALVSALTMKPQERASRAAAARNWARQFSWARSSEAHREVYRKAAASTTS